MCDVIVMSLGLYSNVCNNQYSGSRRVNIKILGGVPSFYQNLSKIPNLTPIVIELRELKKKKKNMDV